MSVFGVRLGNIFARLAAISFLAILSCEKQAPIEPASLDYQKPFGFSWVLYDGEGKQISDSPLVKCRELITKLGGLIAANKKEYFVKLCAQKKYATIYIPHERVPSAFRRGELSVLYRGELEPVLYNYSYLHRVLPNDHGYNTARRKKHAQEIREQLTALYGPPAAYGYYNENSQAEFVTDDREDGPCELWVKESVGIVLCSERVIWVDGIEMALSFIRLDRAPNGRPLQCMIDPASRDDCKSISDADGSSTNDINFLETLAKWVGPDTFRKCESDSLEPIEQRLTLPEDEEARLAATLETYSRDDLARYVFNYAEVVENDEMPVDTQEKVMLYLLEKAASQGSALAMNEMGASLLYCYLHVQQDTHAARAWLEKAAAAGETYAMKSIALMHLSGMTDANDPYKEAVQILKQCAELDEQTCSKELEALNKVLAQAE